MSKNKNHDNNSHTQEDLHDEELNQENFLALQKQLSKVTKENQKLIQEVDQLKAAIEGLKRTIGNGNHTNPLAATATALPGHEARTGSKITVPKSMKLSVAKHPKVIESVSPITSFSITSCEKTLNFSYGPGQPDRKLNLSFSYGGSYGYTYYNLDMATLYTEAENMAYLDKCEYFIHICVVTDGRPTNSNDQRWYHIIPSSKIVKSSTRDGGKNSYSREDEDSDAIKIYLSRNEFKFQSKKIATLDIIVSMSLFLYDSITIDNFISTPSVSRETRTAKLLDFKSQMRTTVTINEVIRCGDRQNQRLPNPLYIAERTLLDSGSPIFIADFKLERPLYRAGINCSLITQKSIDAFSNWVYGIDTKAFADDIQLNMEVLPFAHEFWICDLIKFCIDNICQILEKNFTVELLVKVWQFEEKHKIRNLDECLREVIKSKA